MNAEFQINQKQNSFWLIRYLLYYDYYFNYTIIIFISIFEFFFRPNVLLHIYLHKINTEVDNHYVI